MPLRPAALLEPVCYGIVGVALALTPLLNRLHVESMAVLSFVGFFVAGFVAHREFQRVKTADAVRFRKVLVRRLLWLLVPAATLTVAMLWAPNCDYFRGLLFLFLFPGISVVLAVCFSFFLVAFKAPYWLLVLAGVAVSVVGPLYDIGFHPQFYTYNHVFGGVLGPIYDEALEVRLGLFIFRGLTLLWAGLLFTLGLGRVTVLELVRQRARVGMLFALLAIGLTYLFSAQLGINTPEWYLKSQFSGHRATPHFDLYYDSRTVSPRRVELWVLEHEYRYAALSDRLRLRVRDRIQSFIYTDASMRASLTGARVTSVAPVWLRTPQVHVLAGQIESVFAHELVHVFSREFGLPLVRASLAIGLLEGLAVALEPVGAGPTPAEKVAASRLFDVRDVQLLSEQLASSLGPGGFWGGRGGVSYETSGAFVSWLIERSGIDHFKKVYARGNFSAVYGLSTAELAIEWSHSMASLSSIHRSAAYVAARRFGVLSLFERNCPHWIPPNVREYRTAVLSLSEGEIGIADRVLESLVDSPVIGPAARTALRQINLSRGEIRLLLDEYESESVDILSLTDEIIYADLLAFTGDTLGAVSRYQSVRQRFPVYLLESRTALEMRAVGAQFPEILLVLTSIQPDSQKVAALDRLVRPRFFFMPYSGTATDEPGRSTGDRVGGGVLRGASDRVDGDYGVTEIPTATDSYSVSSERVIRANRERIARFNLVRLYWRGRLNFGSELFAEAAEDASRVIELLSKLEGNVLRDETERTLVYQAARFAFAAGDIGQASSFAMRVAEQSVRAGDSAMGRSVEEFQSRVFWTQTWIEKPRQI